MEMSNRDEGEPRHFVIFSNAGEIDIAAVTTLGVSVKAGPNPIGMFGTGLKYAIAVLLRAKQQIELQSGPDAYEFCLRRKRIRGEDFEIVHMRKSYSDGALGEWESLHFTTSYGRNWTLEHVYRELWSNMKDEGGRVEQASEPPRPASGQTKIIVHGEAFAEVHASRWDFLLNPARRPIDGTSEIEVYAGESDVVFYKGITALKLAKPTRYTYNITKSETLTEDRTLSVGTYYLDQYVRNWITQQAEQAVVQDLITLDDKHHEGSYYYSSLGATPSDAFLSAVHKVMKNNPLKLNATAGDLFLKRTEKEKLDFTARVITSEEQQELDETLERIARWGFDYAHYGFSVKIVDFGGTSIIARVNGASEAIVTYGALLDRDLLEHALIEEFIHMRDKVNDETRQMQNVLFREIIRLARKTEEQEHIEVSGVEGPVEPISGSMEIIDDDEILF